MTVSGERTTPRAFSQAMIVAVSSGYVGFRDIREPNSLKENVRAHARWMSRCVCRKRGGFLAVAAALHTRVTNTLKTTQTIDFSPVQMQMLEDPLFELEKYLPCSPFPT